ncbi:MAG: outer membrane protein assembly factor BamB family protein [Desulfotomaculales bacterium]
MQRLLIVVLLLLINLLTAMPAWAAAVRAVTTFGYSDGRNREGEVDGRYIVPAWYHPGGKSYSQPLVLSGRYLGLADWPSGNEKVVAITAEADKMHAYVFPERPSFPVPHLKPAWTMQLSHTTKSHPTLVEWQGQKLVFIGTESRCLDVFDLTDFERPKNLEARELPRATDIVSAPTAFTWHGHLLIAYTSGRTGDVYILVDPLLSEHQTQCYINLGEGRTSSSPAPVLNGEAFAVGLDQGPGNGKLYVLRFDELFTEQDGRVILKSSPSVYAREDLPSGLCASFAVSDDTNIIYFGDSRSHVYAYDVANRRFLWRNDAAAGLFSNRSPALTEDLVIFPAGTQGSGGKLVAVDRASGRTAWVRTFQAAAQTAPVVLTAPGARGILEGGSNGWLALLDMSGNMVQAVKIAETGLPDPYAQGVSGELSFVGYAGVTTDSQGAKGWWILRHLDFAALSLDPGVPPGQKAKHGRTYTAMVRFKTDYEAWHDLPGVPVEAEVNGKPVQLLDAGGGELPKVTAGGKTFYLLTPTPVGENEYEVRFNWTAMAGPDGKAVLTAWINLPRGRITQVYPEPDTTNNLVEVEVPVEGVDLSVTDFRVVTDPVRQCYRASASVVARNRSDKQLTTQIKFYGPGGVQTRQITLAPNGQVPLTFTFDAPCKEGTYSLRVTINETRAIEETNYANNEARCTYRVIGLPEGECNHPSNSWIVEYTCYDICCNDEGNCSCCQPYKVTVSYSQRIKTTVNLDTGFGGTYKWFEGYPWAQPFGKYGNEIRDKHRTKAGYIVYLDVTTDYWTDWETKVPGCPCVSAFGGKGEGPEEVEVRFPFKVHAGPGKELIDRIFLVPEKPRGSRQNTWKLPACEGYFREEKPEAAWYPVFVPDKNTPDGDYLVTVIVHPHGFAHEEGSGFLDAAERVCQTVKIPIKIRGVLWDDFAPGVG